MRALIAISRRAFAFCLFLLLIENAAWAQILPATLDTNAPKPRELDPQRRGSDSSALTAVESAINRMNAARPITALGENAFGDSFDPASGNLRFFHTDVRLKGTGPDIAISRSLDVGKTTSAWWERSRGFADWELELPRMTTRTPHPSLAGKWQVTGANPTARCTSFGRARDVTILNHNHPASEWWDGVQLIIPGEGSQELMPRAAQNALSPSVFSWPLVTTNHWMVACLPGTYNSATEPGEAFLAVSPDGTKYWFDYLTVGDYDWYSLPQMVGWAMYRYEAQMLPSRIEDRFGNALTFTYNAGRLTDVVATDGRAVRLTWTTVNNISYITRVTEQPGDAKERKWDYAYLTPSTGRTLHQVTQPDTRKWTYQFEQLTRFCLYWQPDAQSPWCDDNIGAVGQNTGTVTAPSGLVGTFTVGGFLGWRDLTQATSDCFHEAPGSNEQFFAVGLFSKVFSGPGLVNQTWSTGGWTCPYPGCQPAMPFTNLTRMNHPDGKITLYHVSNAWCTANYGEVLRTDIDPVFNGSGQLTGSKQSVTTQRALPNAGPFPARIGVVAQTYANRKALEYLRPSIRRDLVQDGVTFTREVQTLDTYGRPLRVKRFSSLGAQRIETTAYHDNLAKWVTGQVASITEQSTGAVMFGQTFDPTTADVLTQSKFGQLMQSLTYNADGTVLTTSDSAGRATQYTNYKRGIPQTVTPPDNHANTAVVNNIGEVTSTTDTLGNTTSYGYDAMSRLNATTFPSSDTVGWLQETYTFEPVTAAEYGLTTGHWRHRTTRGNYRKDVFFDARWHPVIEREYDSTNAEATDRFVVRNFDAEGRQTFESYARDSLSAWGAVTYGNHTAFDHLGRVVQTKQVTDEWGDLITQTEYLTGFQTRVTDPKLNPPTVTTYRVLDEPTTEAPLIISAPEGQTTTLVRDVFGKPTSVTRSGPWTGATCGAQANTLCATRQYVYDAQQRLCKTIEPESGSAVVDYDTAGNLMWRATGLNLPALNDCNRTTVSVPESVRTVYGYDLLNRVLSINYPSTTEDIAYTYYADGALWTATAGDSVWTYEYNKRRLLEKETLTLPERTYAFDWYYNTHAYLAGVYYPGSVHIDYQPNILGQATRAASFATSAVYFPNGAVDTFAFGNGALRDVSQTSNKATRQIRDTFGANVLLDVTLGYDKNGNINQVTDAVSGGWDTRTLGYDGRDRLTSVTLSPTGNETYGYDPLDNVRRATYPGFDRRFHYDAKNRLEFIKSPSGVTEYGLTWTNAGELSSRTNHFSTQPSTPPTGTVFRNGFEDATGTGTENFGFDAAGRLSTLQGLTSYNYDAHKRRVRTTLPSWGPRFEAYSRDGRLLLAEDSLTKERTDYIYMGATLVAKRVLNTQTSAVTTTYLHNDYRDSTAVESNSAGGVVRRTRVTPFGEPVDGVYPHGKGFAGHAFDEVGGLVYMQQRYYDPLTMRFLSTDPRPSTPLSFNRFWYARNNPYVYLDPDGAEAPCVTLGSGCFTTGAQELQEWANFLDWSSDRLFELDSALMSMGPHGAGGSKLMVYPAARLMRVAAGSATVAARVEQAAVGTISSSRALAASLHAAGFARPLGSATHHIVAGNARAAAPARRVLEKFSIGINDAINGVFLPATKTSPNAAGAVVHSSMHTAAYYERVNEILGAARTREEAMSALATIRTLMLSGEW